MKYLCACLGAGIILAYPELIDNVSYRWRFTEVSKDVVMQINYIFLTSIIVILCYWWSVKTAKKNGLTDIKQCWVDKCFWTISVGCLIVVSYLQYWKEKNLYSDAFKYGCRSILTNLWFSLLVFGAVSIVTWFLAKIRNKVLRSVIVLFSIAMCDHFKMFAGQFLQNVLGIRIGFYLVDRPNANGCFVVAESLLRAIVVGVVIFEVIRYTKKQITPIQTGLLVASLNLMTLCKYTLDKHDFFRLFPFPKPIYMIKNLKLRGYGTITFIIGVMFTYLVIRAVFFNKKMSWPSLNKLNTMHLTPEMGIKLIACCLVILKERKRIRIIYQQAYAQKMYIEIAVIVAVGSLAVMGVEYVMKNRQDDKQQGKIDKKHEIENGNKMY